MHTPLTQNDSAIARGIKCVGIGKRGRKSLEPSLIEDILADLRSGKVPAIAQGAFFGALVIKGVSSDEMKLDEAFAPATPWGAFLAPLGIKGFPAEEINRAEPFPPEPPGNPSRWGFRSVPGAKA